MLSVALLLLTVFGVLAPALFALIFAVYQSPSSVAEFCSTFYQIFVFYVILGAPIIVGLCGVYLVVAALFVHGLLWLH